MDYSDCGRNTPISILWEGILFSPVAGVLDSHRAQMLMDSLLEKVLQTRSRCAILDILGVEAVDTAVANHLVRICKATRLMGCESIISGLSPSVAQTIVHLGIDLADVTTTATLADALRLAFRRHGLHVQALDRDAVPV